MFALSTRARTRIQQVAGSMAAAGFAFHFFLYGYCLQVRPREPAPDLGFDHPFNLKGLVVYVSSVESLFLNAPFFCAALLFIVIVLWRSRDGRVLQYDVHRGKVVWGQAVGHIEWRPVVLLIALWLTLLVAAWRAFL